MDSVLRHSQPHIFCSWCDFLVWFSIIWIILLIDWVFYVLRSEAVSKALHGYMTGPNGTLSFQEEWETRWFASHHVYVWTSWWIMLFWELNKSGHSHDNPIFSLLILFHTYPSTCLWQSRLTSFVKLISMLLIIQQIWFSFPQVSFLPTESK